MSKVGIIGVGNVGSHGALMLQTFGICNEIVLIDKDKKKELAQARDLQDLSSLVDRKVKINMGKYSDLDDADIIVISAGPKPDPSRFKDRMEALGETIVEIDDIIENIKKTKFNGIILNVSNPADVVTAYIQNKLNWDINKIFSTSTTLDSCRLKRAISMKLGVDEKSITAYVLGEHGESQMVTWSNAYIGGKKLTDLMKEKPSKYGNLNLEDLAFEGRHGGWDILMGKKCTQFGIGTVIARICQCILFDEHRIFPVTTLLSNGLYGQNHSYASVPCVISKKGIEEIISLELTKEEMALFNKSCKSINDNLSSIL